MLAAGRTACAEVREAVSAALDGEASETDVRTAVTHVRLCRGCRDFLLAVGLTTRAIRGSGVIRPSSIGHRG